MKNNFASKKKNGGLFSRAIFRPQNYVVLVLVIYFMININLLYNIDNYSGNKISQQKGLPKTSVRHLIEKDGGFCHITSCKIGKTLIREAFQQAPEASSVVQSNPSNKFIITPVDQANTLTMMIRDPKLDTFISGKLAKGMKHDEHIQNLVVRSFSGKDNTVFIDVGANIGYFTATALAVGASQTVSFEPFYENAGVLMSTIEQNHWKKRATVYMNTVGYESNRVSMKSTHDKINLSNMHITGSQCVTGIDDVYPRDRRYGLDYMETISLDQVLLTNHRDIHRVQLMKIDVETFEMQVLNGAMHSLCNLIIERIVVEVEYLKPVHKLKTPCNFDLLQRTLIEMGYDILDVGEKESFTTKRLPDFPPDVVFKLIDMTQSPVKRLGSRSGNNVCQRFDMSNKSKGQFTIAYLYFSALIFRNLTFLLSLISRRWRQLV